MRYNGAFISCSFAYCVQKYEEKMKKTYSVAFFLLFVFLFALILLPLQEDSRKDLITIV